MSKKVKYVILIIVSIVLIATFPYIMDKFIIGNQIKSNISNSEWVGFLGSYIGALLGAVLGFVGIILTIRYTREENRADRELQIKPYFDIKYDITDTTLRTPYSLGYIAYSCDDSTRDEDAVFGLIAMKNIGLGSAINCYFDIQPIDDGRTHFPVLLTSTKNGFYDSVVPQEKGSISIRIAFNFDKIKKEDLGDDGFPKISLRGKYKNHDIVINFYYEDILHNKYCQKIILGVSIYTMKSKTEEIPSYKGEILLKEVGKSEKVI